MTQPLFVRHEVGDTTITALRDGTAQLPLAALSNIEEADATALLAAVGRSPQSGTSVNAFVIQRNGTTTLIDTGTLPGIMPGTSNLRAALEAAGITPTEIGLILMTHLHVDHVGHLVTPAGNAMFPSAQLGLHEAEAGFWLDEARAERAPEEAKLTFTSARKGLAPYKDRTHTFRDGEVAPGITAIPLPGHTPGHTGYKIGDNILIWGDIVHFPDIQSRQPEVGVRFDSDPAQAIEARRHAFELAAADKLLIGGMHMHFPGLAHLERRDGAYAFVPAA